MSDLNSPSTCGGCGAELAAGVSICPKCGWDQTTAIVRPTPPPLGRTLLSVGLRVVLYGVLIALPLLGFMRLRTTGPGPDLPTTLRWMVLGDGGRAAALVTLHRAHEIGGAAARWAVRELAAFPFEGDWEPELAPYSTMEIRDFIPMLFIAADAGAASDALRELYEVRSTDGWGRPYRVSALDLPRGSVSAEFPQVTADFAEGLRTSFFNRANPELGDTAAWRRLEIVSAGADGGFDTADDIVFITYHPVEITFRVQGTAEQLSEQLSRAYTVGRQYFRFTAPEGDLVDARLLAEWRAEVGL